MRRFIFSLALAALAGFAPACCLAADDQDKAAAQQIAQILKDSGQMKGYSVAVKYNNGTVWLNGKVASQQQLQTALKVVSDIQGVERIVNGLEVAPTGQPGVQQASMMAPQQQAQQKSLAKTAQPGPQGPPMPIQRTGAQMPAAPGEIEQAGFHHHHGGGARPMPMYAPTATGPHPAAMDQAYMPNYAWPSYATAPNYAAVTYPKQYSASAFPFIGPFYPYPQVPLGWRKVSLEWDDGWWFLDFYDRGHH